MAGVILGMIFVFALYSGETLLSGPFYRGNTYQMIASRIPRTIIAAVGMTYVLIIAEIDLSVGSVLAFTGAILGVGIVEWGLPVWLAITACLGTGILIGVINGLITIGWNVPSFIVTLGMLEMARGGTYLVTQSRTKYIGQDISFIAEMDVFGLPLPFIIALAIVIIGQIVLSYTVFGRYMIAIGTNEEAVRLSGISPWPIKLAVFVISAFLISVGAVLFTSRMENAGPNVGIAFELKVIAAVVIGGTSLMGGRGSVIRSFFGVLIIAVLGQGLASLGAAESTKRLVTGAVIVVAVILDYYRRRLESASE